jgi:hypothetical protein
VVVNLVFERQSSALPPEVPFVDHSGHWYVAMDLGGRPGRMRGAVKMIPRAESDASEAAQADGASEAAQADGASEAAQADGASEAAQAG